MKDLKQEFKIQEIKVKAIVIHTLKATDTIEDFFKLKKIGDNIKIARTMYFDKNNERKSTYDIEIKDFPIKLIAFPYSDEDIKTLEDLLKDDLPF